MEPGVSQLFQFLDSWHPCALIFPNSPKTHFTLLQLQHSHLFSEVLILSGFCPSRKRRGKHTELSNLLRPTCPSRCAGGERDRQTDRRQIGLLSSTIQGQEILAEEDSSRSLTILLNVTCGQRTTFSLIAKTGGGGEIRKDMERYIYILVHLCF